MILRDTTEVARRITLLAAIAVTSGCWPAYTRVTPQDVDAAVRAAGIVGRSPADAERALRGIRLRHGRTLQVGQYNRRTREMGAVVLDAKRLLYQTWNVDIAVLFDSTDHVANVVTHYSAEHAP